MCLLGVPCRYDNQAKEISEEVARFREIYHLLPVCPEQLGGLPTPRPPTPAASDPKQMLNAESGGEGGIGEKMVNAEGTDVTQQFIDGAYAALKLARMFNIRKAYLKSRSPSCDKTIGVTGCLLEMNGITVINIDYGD